MHFKFHTSTYFTSKHEYDYNQTLFHFFHQVKKKNYDSTIQYIQYIFFILQDLKPNEKYKNITLNQDCNCHSNLLSQMFNS